MNKKKSAIFDLNVLPRYWLRSILVFAVFLVGVLHSAYLLRLGGLERLDEIVNDYRWLSVMPSDLPSSPTAFSYQTTGIKQRYAGTFNQLKAVSSWLDRRIRIAPDFAMTYELLQLCACLLLFMWGSRKVSHLSLLVWSVGISWLLLVINFQLHRRYSWGLPIASSMLICWAVAAMALGSLILDRIRTQLAAFLGVYVPPELVAKMLSNPMSFSTAARTQEMTVMFCDLRNFTQLSETMEPLQLQLFLSQVLGRFSQIIQKNQGTVDKYIGDCVMAFWGAPDDVPQHAEMALRTVLQIQAEVEKMNARSRMLGGVQIAVSMGVNTGHMCVGDMGSEARRSYTVIGDAVNMAAHLQDMAEAYGVTALAGQATRRILPHWAWREFPDAQIRGKKLPESVFSPVL
jgi:adenylate cyclase